MKKFYEFKKISEEETELLIYGELTSSRWCESDVSSYDFAKELNAIDTDLRVRINSYGGEASEGLAIYSLLKSFNHKVTTICDGFACSCASVIFMAGQERIMNQSSLLLIHNAWTYAEGDSNALRKKADDLEKITQPSIDIYTSVTGLKESVIKEMMDEEKWITPQEALEMGFATKVLDDGAKQSINEMYLNHQVLANKLLLKQVQELETKIEDLQKNEPKNAWSSFFNSKK